MSGEVQSEQELALTRVCVQEVGKSLPDLRSQGCPEGETIKLFITSK